MTREGFVPAVPHLVDWAPASEEFAVATLLCGGGVGGVGGVLQFLVRFPPLPLRNDLFLELQGHNGSGLLHRN